MRRTWRAGSAPPPFGIMMVSSRANLTAVSGPRGRRLGVICWGDSHFGAPWAPGMSGLLRIVLGVFGF
eukprot:7659768-Pyramimonas_sp.AAC.1